MLALRLLLAAVFATAGVGKLLDRDGSLRALRDFGVPERLAPAGAVALPIAELAVAVGLLFPPSARWAAVAGTILLLLFIAGIAAALRRGEAPDCHCFGQIHSEPAGTSTLVRNAVLAVAAGVVAVAGPGPSINGWLADRTAVELTLTAVVVAAAFGLVTVWHRRTRRKVEAAATRPIGLPVGTTAPDFTFQLLDGTEATLGDLRARERPTMIVFTHPHCGPCRLLLPDLARWQSVLADRLTIAIISEGEPGDHDGYRKHGLADVMIQPGRETYNAFAMRGTPSAVVVSRDGRIASATSIGNVAIESLIRVTLAQPVSQERRSRSLVT